MAGTITSDQTLIKAAEVVADYLDLGTWASARALNDDIRVEGTYGINGRVSANTAWALAATPSANLDLSTGAHVFMWIKNLTWPSTDTRANGGIGISISADATPTLTGTTPSNGPTNSKTWYLGGNNTDSFTGWVCYVVDPQGTGDLTLGTYAANSVDRVGIRAKVTGTVTNKTLNIQYDVCRYGTGLTIKDGTGQTAAAFSDIYTSDSSSTNAWGVLTNQNGIYFLGGRLTFGTTSQAAVTVFKDTSQTVVYQYFPVAATFYLMTIQGASGQKTSFVLGSYDPATALTSLGCTIRGTSDPLDSTKHSIWTLTASDANQVMRLYGSTFSELDSAALAYNTINFNVASCTTTINVATVSTTNNFNTAGVVPGMLVTGTGIAASTYVTTVDSNTQITMNKNATASGTVTLTFEHSSEMRGCIFNNFADITTNGCLIDDCTFRNVKTTTPISGTYALIVASTTQMSRITNSKFINCNRAIKITATGTYAFSNLTFSGNTYDVENSNNGANVSDIYAESNSDGTIALNDTVIGVSQSFTGDGNVLANAVFYLSKTNTPSGTATAKVYAHSGTFASSSLPTGTALATSQTLDVTTLTGSLALTTFYFIGTNNITLTNTTKYCVTIEYSSGTSTNTVNVGRDASSATAAGSCATLSGTTWTSTATTTDAVFYVRTGGIVTVNASNGSNPAQSRVINTGSPPGSTTINNSVNLTINGLTSGARCYMEVTSGGDTVGTVLMSTTANTSGVATVAYNYPGSDVIVKVRARLVGYLPFETSGTITDAGLTVTAVWQVDNIA